MKTRLVMETERGEIELLDDIPSADFALDCSLEVGTVKHIVCESVTDILPLQCDGVIRYTN